MIENKKAFYDYEILEDLECGLILESWEVKSIASNNCSISGSFCRAVDGRFYLTGATIGPDTEDRNRDRGLLLHFKEIKRLLGKTQEKGLTIVPLKLYNKNGKFKLLIGLARGKKLHDKRETDKKRTIENENRKIVKSQTLI